MVKNSLAISVACVFLLVGCGSSDDETSTESDTNTTEADTNTGEDPTEDNTSVLTGVFVDSAVEGVSYSTSSQSGITNSEGEFNYIQGEQVVFSIGAIQLPSVAGAPVVSPVDMAAGSTNELATTTNIARLLQSLDTDNNPDNGITIPTTATETVVAINFDVGIDEFENNPDVINLVADSGSINTSLISAEEAIDHLTSTLGTTATDGVNDGIWLSSPASETESGLPDYTVVDGLNFTRYNSAISSDGNACYSVSTNSITPLGDNRFQLNGADGSMFFDMVRVDDTLEVTFGGEATLVFPRAEGVDLASLPLCTEDFITGDVNTDDVNTDDVNTDDTNNEDNTPAPVRDIVTLEDFTATIVGRQLVLINSDGTRNPETQVVIGETKVIGFTSSGNLELDWFWDDTVYCRSGVVGLPDNPATLELECQAVSVNENRVIFRRDRGEGVVANRWFIE